MSYVFVFILRGRSTKKKEKKKEKKLKTRGYRPFDSGCEIIKRLGQKVSRSSGQNCHFIADLNLVPATTKQEKKN